MQGAQNINFVIVLFIIASTSDCTIRYCKYISLYYLLLQVPLIVLFVIASTSDSFHRYHYAQAMSLVS